MIVGQAKTTVVQGKNLKAINLKWQQTASGASMQKSRSLRVCYTQAVFRLHVPHDTLGNGYPVQLPRSAGVMYPVYTLSGPERHKNTLDNQAGSCDAQDTILLTIVLFISDSLCALDSLRAVGVAKVSLCRQHTSQGHPIGPSQA